MKKKPFAYYWFIGWGAIALLGAIFAICACGYLIFKGQFAQSFVELSLFFFLLCMSAIQLTKAEKVEEEASQ